MRGVVHSSALALCTPGQKYEQLCESSFHSATPGIGIPITGPTTYFKTAMHEPALLKGIISTVSHSLAFDNSFNATSSWYSIIPLR